MTIRLAAAWSLIGVVAQCLVCLARETGLGEGATLVLWHGLGWAMAGWIVGSLVEWAMVRAYQPRHGRLPGRSVD